MSEQYDYLEWAKKDISDGDHESAQACALVALAEATKRQADALEELRDLLRSMTKVAGSYDEYSEHVDLTFLRIWMGYD